MIFQPLKFSILHILGQKKLASYYKAERLHAYCSQSTLHKNCSRELQPLRLFFIKALLLVVCIALFMFQNFLLIYELKYILMSDGRKIN